MLRPVPMLLVAAVAAIVLAGCGGSDDSTPATVEGFRILKLIEIHESEFELDPSTIRVDRIAIYGLKIVNDGDEPHALRIDGPRLHRATGTIQPGESTTIAVFLREHGDYELICPLDGHAGKGMRATITVG